MKSLILSIAVSLFSFTCLAQQPMIGRSAQGEYQEAARVRDNRLEAHFKADVQEQAESIIRQRLNISDAKISKFEIEVTHSDDLTPFYRWYAVNPHFACSGRITAKPFPSGPQPPIQPSVVKGNASTYNVTLMDCLPRP